MNIFTRKLTVPESINTKEIDVAQTWDVRWNSLRVYYGDRLVRCKPELESFLSESEACDFARALTNARKILKLSQSTDIKVTKRTQKRK